MKGWRMVAVSAGVLALAACQLKEGVPIIDQMISADRARCEELAKRAKAANWAQAETIDITISEDRFSPLNLMLRRGRPYILRIANTDKVVHSFGSRAFFQSVATAKIVFGGEVSAKTCVPAIHVAAKGTAELHVVPEVRGDFEVEDNVGLFGLSPFARSGFIVVSVR